MATLLTLPPHLWALVLRNASVSDVCSVAHVCRALHRLILSPARCTCTTYPCPLDEPLCGEPQSATHAFWTHMREAMAAHHRPSWAVHLYCGNAMHVILALRSGADPSEELQWAVRWASDQGRATIVEYLLRDARVDPSVEEQCALLWACEAGSVPVVERLLRDERVDPSYEWQSALRIACEWGHIDVAERLLQDERVASALPALRVCAHVAQVSGQLAVAAVLRRHVEERH